MKRKVNTNTKAYETLIRAERILNSARRAITGKQSSLPYNTAVLLERKVSEVKEVIIKHKESLERLAR